MDSDRRAVRRRVFDRPLLDRRRRRAAREARPGADFLLRRAAEDLSERLAAVTRTFDAAVDLGTASPLLADLLKSGGQISRLWRLDTLPDFGADVLSDPEALPLAAESLDLIVSALALHFVDDLPGLLVQVRRALRPDGLFLATLLGTDTLDELRVSMATAEAEIRGGAAPRVAPFAGLRDLAGLLQRAGFALPVVDRDRIVVRYDSMGALLRDLRAMGATSVLVDRDRRPLTRAILRRAGEIYGERFSDPDGRFRATFTLISLSGWCPHESQQRPLQPGSGRRRLADALGATEHSAGEPARPAARKGSGSG